MSCKRQSISKPAARKQEASCQAYDIDLAVSAGVSRNRYNPLADRLQKSPIWSASAPLAMILTMRRTVLSPRLRGKRKGIKSRARRRDNHRKQKCGTGKPNDNGGHRADALVFGRILVFPLYLHRF